jgi:hypothetical protein
MGLSKQMYLQPRRILWGRPLKKKQLLGTLKSFKIKRVNKRLLETLKSFKVRGLQLKGWGLRRIME